MATQTQLIGGSFQDALGNPLEDGYLILHLSQDCLVSGVGTICSGIDIRIQLDSAGNAASSTSTPPAANQFVWSNLVMTPQNNFYKVTGYTAEGQRAFGPNNQQVASGATFNLDAWVPNTVISWFPTLVPTILLEVNGVPTSSQAIANFVAGSGMTVTDEGGGVIAFASSVVLNVEVNGTPLASTNPINFESGTGIAVTNTSAGNVLITNTNTGTTFNNPGVGYFWGAGIVRPLFDLVEAGTIAADSQVVYVFEFVLETNWAIGSASYMTDNGASDSFFGFGIYSLAGNALVTTSFLTTATSGNTPVTNTFSQVSLPAGVYYFAQSADNTVVQGPVFQFDYTGQSPVDLFGLMNAGSQPVAMFATNTMGVNTGVMPTTLGTLTPLTNQSFNGLATVKWTP